VLFISLVVLEDQPMNILLTVQRRHVLRTRSLLLVLRSSRTHCPTSGRPACLCTDCLTKKLKLHAAVASGHQRLMAAGKL